MGPIATGAHAANRNLLCIGISGDGDSLSIGLGHLAHLIRRNARMVYIIENNGVYGLTKGQLSATADVGTTMRRGTPNVLAPIDPMLLGLTLGATFLARGFSGDKQQLVPIIKAAAAHRGLALIDVISPCVTFNDHAGSTKSYLFTRQHDVRVNERECMDARLKVGRVESEEITHVTMRDGSILRAQSVPEGYDPSDRRAVADYLSEAHERGEVITGILYVDESSQDLHERSNTSLRALVDIPFSVLCPGATELAKFGVK
jgi:2-oxoglutarate ferredoxin oxidoreductase subunit beta